MRHGKYIYRSLLEDYGDVLKNSHYAIADNGEQVFMDFTPYAEMDLETFQMMVELGLPDRSETMCVPWDRDSVLKAYVEYKKDRR